MLLRPEFGWSGILLGAIIVSIVEVGYIPMNDNLLIPLAASVAFMICYGLKPVTLAGRFFG